MSRNLKALGLALVASLALGVTMASSASAATFTSGSDSTTLSSKALNNQVFTSAAGNVTCEEVNVDEATAGTSQSSITATPTYSKNCTVLSFTAQVDTNGCHYTFQAAGTVSVTCPEGKEIQVTAFILGAFRKCLAIPAQTPTVPKVHYINETEVTGGKNVWDVTLVSTVEGITYTKEGSCGSGTFNDATYDGKVTVWGTDVNGPVDVTADE